jgi:WD40 repeat protein
MQSEAGQPDSGTRADQERDDTAARHEDGEPQPARVLMPRRVIRAVLGLIVTVAVVAAVGFGWAFMAQRHETAAQFRDATVARLYAQSQLQLGGLSQGGNDDVAAMQMVLAARAIPSTLPGDDYVLAALNQERELIKDIDTPAGVASVAFSPDGLRIAAGGADGTIWLWDAAAGQPIGQPLRGHQKIVTSVAFSPDGTRIASSSMDNTVRLWDAATGQQVGQPLRGHENAVMGVAFSPDGTRLASGSTDGTIRLWNTATGEPIGQPLRGHDRAVIRVAFSPDGTHIASGGTDKTVQLWDAATGQPVGQPMRGHDEWVMSLAFSPDGARIASGSLDKTVRLWDVATGQPIGQPLHHGNIVSALAFSPDGTRIATAGGDNTIRFWDASTGEALGVLAGHRSAVESVAFSPDGRRLLSGGDDQSVRIWDASAGQPLLGHTDTVGAAEFSADGRRIRSGSADGTVRMWDLATGQPIGPPLRVVDHVRFLDPLGEDRAVSAGDAGVQLWDAHTGKPIGEPLHTTTDPILSVVTWNPKTGSIATQTEPGAIEVRDAAMKPVGVTIWTGKPVSWFDISPDDRMIVTTSADSTLRLWDVATGKPVGKPLTGNGLIVSTTFSPDGHLLAAGANGLIDNTGNTLRLWDTRTFEPVDDPIHVNSVVSVPAFSPDGRILATGSADGTIRLWDVGNHKQLGAPLTGHASFVSSLYFNPDGTKLLSGSADHTLRIWPVPTSSPDALCAKVTHNMSHKQWHEWVSSNIDYITVCPSLPIPDDAQPR